MYQRKSNGVVWYLKVYTFFFSQFLKTYATVCMLFITFCVILVIHRFVPESCRYLIVKKRHKEAEQTLRKIAKVNKKKYPEEELVAYKEQRTGDIRDLFGSWKMVHRTLVCWFSW